MLERGQKGMFGAWFPDFPGCVAGGTSQEEAIEKAENTLAQEVDALFEQGRPLPEPTPIGGIALPKGCDLVAYFIVGVDPPDPSERVNVYLPKSLIGRADRRAAELGMSRSSFFGLAINGRARLVSRPRRLSVSDGAAALEGAQDRWTAQRKIAGEEVAAQVRETDALRPTPLRSTSPRLHSTGAATM